MLREEVAMSEVAYFLKISEIPGESQDKAHEDEIEIASWSWGLSKPGGAGSGGGGAARKPTFQDISLQKQVDKSSPNLAKACVGGEHFREAVLAAQRGSGPNFSLDLIVIKLSDVTITEFQEGVEVLGSLPSDSFAIRFAKIDYSYMLQKADGTADKPVRWTWDIKANKSF
jgi:type VI secretion system secreted protein Hcp